MTSSSGRGLFSYQFPARILASAALAIVLCLGAATPGHAQEDEAPAWSLKRLFTSRKSEPPAAEAAPPEAAPPAAARRKARVTREPIDPQSTVEVKRPDASVIMVVGDFLASGLAEGLATAFVENPHVRVVDRTNGSSGLVRDDFYDWPARIGELIDAEKPAAVVIMLGANDRQQMKIGGDHEAVRSEAWVKAYAARAQALAKAVADRKVPFAWVGVPSFKSSKMLLDMLAFNEIYKATATATGGEFIDIWDGFVDEDGGYVANGPDLNGQPARLRAADGINLARPGKRKLAFYAEKPLAKMLGDAVTPQVAEADAAATPAEASPFGPLIAPLSEEAEVVIGPSDLGPIDPGRPISLRSPALDGGAELLGLVAEPRHDARTPGEKLAIEGIAPAPTPGRADDFSWQSDSAVGVASAIEPPRPTKGKDAVPSVLVARVVPETPPAAPAMLGTPDPVDTQLPAAPTALPETPAAAPRAGDRPPVSAAAPTASGPDLAAAAKQPVSLTPPADAADRSPQRAGPSQAPLLPPSSGPTAEGAPTVLPEPEIELAPVIVETPVAALPAPTVLASLQPARPTGARPDVFSAPQGPRRDAAPRPLSVSRAALPPPSSGPAAAGAPAVPARLPEDRAAAKFQVGSLPEAPPATAGRRAAPTDPAAVTATAVPGRAAPSTPEALPSRSAPSLAGKPPSALVATARDVAPAQPAPNGPVTEARVEPTLRLAGLRAAPTAAILPAAATPPDMLAAPTSLRGSLDPMATPALAMPPQTPAGPGAPALAMPSLPPVDAASPEAKSSPVPDTDMSGLRGVPPDLLPAPQAAPEKPAAVEPAASSGPSAQAATVASLRQDVPAADDAPDGARIPEDVKAAEDVAAGIPETDISALFGVPPDLLAPPAIGSGSEASAAGVAATPAAAEGERQKEGQADGFAVFDSVDDIPAPRLDTPVGQ